MASKTREENRKRENQKRVEAEIIRLRREASYMTPEELEEEGTAVPKGYEGSYNAMPSSLTGKKDRVGYGRHY